MIHLRFEERLERALRRVTTARESAGITKTTPHAPYPVGVRALLFLTALAVPAVAGATTAPPPPLGINFGCGSCGSGLTYGTNYTYDTIADIDAAYKTGVRTLRIGRNSALK